jgi:hypothetical protein
MTNFLIFIVVLGGEPGRGAKQYRNALHELAT